MKQKPPNKIEPALTGAPDPERALYPKGGLCHRCDNRANALETGAMIRPQCLDMSVSLKACYAWRPVRPVIIAPDENDDRPILGSLDNSARMSFVRTIEDDEFRMRLVNVNGEGVTVIWVK